MGLKADHSHLPKDRSGAAGEPPDVTPRFAPLLVERWMEAERERGPKPTAHDTRLRFSDAGGCARNLGMAAAGFPISDPMDAAGVWVTRIGSTIHEAWQEALAAQYPNVEIETRLRVEGLDCSGHLDAGITLGARISGETSRIAYELKTGGGFGFKLKVGERGDAQGPDYTHKLQAALEAEAWGADELVIGYLALEAISKPAAERMGKRIGRDVTEYDRFCAEWTYTPEQFLPWAQAERKRMARILEVVDSGHLPPTAIPDPEIPHGAVITDPATGRWELWSQQGGPDEAATLADTGATWRCGYCPRQKACALVNNPGKVAIASAVSLLADESENAGVTP